MIGRTEDPVPTILVVDDDVAMAEELAEGIASAGFRTLWTLSARDATSALAERPEIAVIVLQARIRGLEGAALAGEALARRATGGAVEFVLLMDVATGEEAPPAWHRDVAAVLRTPFRLEDAARAIIVAMAVALARREAAVALASPDLAQAAAGALPGCPPPWAARCVQCRGSLLH